MCGGIWAVLNLCSSLMCVSRQLYDVAALTLENYIIHWTEDWVGHRTIFEASGKRNISGFRWEWKHTFSVI
jgi:hypothetical protein